MRKADTVRVYTGRDGRWYWQRRDRHNGQVIATGGQGYANRSWCIRMARRINRRARIEVDA